MTADLGHLLPEYQQETTLSDEERIRRIRLDRWINYPRAESILGRMRELLSYPRHDRMPALLLYGATGMGKTKILRKFCREYPHAFDRTVGISCMQIVSMQMPPEPDEKSFYGELLDSLGSPINHGQNASQMRRTARDLLQFVNARVLIIDELHSLLAGTHRQQQILLNALRFLANDLQLPLICAGTADAKRALMTDRQLADRFEAVELPAWHNDDAYGRLLASFLGILPLRQRSDLLAAAVRKTLLEHTEGVTVRIVRLIEILAIDAIRSGRERINQESLAALSSLAPLLSMEEHSHGSFAS
jgi:replication-associated recombination protein RarA